MEIAVELQRLAERAREKKLSLEEMSGGGITISNLGGIGGTYFTPIVNWPEVAILGVSRGTRREPVWKDGRMAAASDAAAVALLRPSRDRRRRCDAVPAMGCRGDRATLPSLTGRMMTCLDSAGFPSTRGYAVRHSITLMASESTQVAVLGAGPGGYAAAFYAADLGMQVALIDEEKNPGGVCLYRGCIPSKALLHVAKVIDEAQTRGQLGRDLRRAHDRRRQASLLQAGRRRQADAGVGSVAKLRKVKFLQGRATLTGPTSLKVAGAGGETELQFEHLILATGSHPTRVPSLSLDSPRMMDSTSGLELPDVPKSLLVVGGGYIGLELGSVYATLGSKVSVVEMTPGLLPGADRDLVGVLEKRLKKLFAAIMLNTKVVKVAEEGPAFA